MKLVMTIEYSSGDYNCGTTQHYCLEGESPEAVRTEFFMALEEAEAAFEKDEAELDKKILEIANKYADLKHKTFKRNGRETAEFRSEHYLKPKVVAYQERNQVLDFKFRLNKFSISDFTDRIFVDDKKVYKINYDMVVVRSLDDWYNEYLLENQ